MMHRSEGSIGSFTVHSPADYQPTHLASGVWWDTEHNRPADVYCPPEHTVFRRVASIVEAWS